MSNNFYIIYKTCEINKSENLYKSYSSQTKHNVYIGHYISLFTSSIVKSSSYSIKSSSLKSTGIEAIAISVSINDDIFSVKKLV